MSKHAHAWMLTWQTDGIRTCLENLDGCFRKTLQVEPAKAFQLWAEQNAKDYVGSPGTQVRPELGFHRIQEGISSQHVCISIMSRHIIMHSLHLQHTTHTHAIDAWMHEQLRLCMPWGVFGAGALELAPCAMPHVPMPPCVHAFPTMQPCKGHTRCMAGSQVYHKYRSRV